MIEEGKEYFTIHPEQWDKFSKLDSEHRDAIYTLLQNMDCMLCFDVNYMLRLYKGRADKKARKTIKGIEWISLPYKQKDKTEYFWFAFKGTILKLKDNETKQ